MDELNWFLIFGMNKKTRGNNGLYKRRKEVYRNLHAMILYVAVLLELS